MVKVLLPVTRVPRSVRPRPRAVTVFTVTNPMPLVFGARFAVVHAQPMALLILEVAEVLIAV
eukprot:CAMPEP_0182576338 /NCGR_PEP_ID=MMETSP1324-20130603/33467_1 /TAXON_ID=236786 /ORGANISM="Florenciella sp., Strain RCC1587" /LENGTH=61 /DNA_ID=CAMNT_0024792027 /DNA_START=30 /DNA_END=211 /DNA_ORIENTATION=+